MENKKNPPPFVGESAQRDHALFHPAPYRNFQYERMRRTSAGIGVGALAHISTFLTSVFIHKIREAASQCRALEHCAQRQQDRSFVGVRLTQTRGADFGSARVLVMNNGY